MTVRLGLLLSNAEIVDIREKGEVTTIDVRCRGATKRACKRGARREVSSVIPIPEQNFINETQLDSGLLEQKWLFTVSGEGGES